MLSVRSASASLVPWAEAQQLSATEILLTAGEMLSMMCLMRPNNYIGLAAAAFNEAKFQAYAA